MEAVIVIQGKTDPPKLQSEIRLPLIDFSEISKMTFCLIEGGMASGEHSVIMMVVGQNGTVVTQTSLDKFLQAASGMAAAAESHWGWKRPEGHATIMPMDPEARRTILEAIKKELEEWDE